jgi:hypothetical protein
VSKLIKILRGIRCTGIAVWIRRVAAMHRSFAALEEPFGVTCRPETALAAH